jgi:uncharacterized protein (TIGR04255 family)
MSKLSKAPLIEVVLELKWDMLNKEDLNDSQYLYGDIYSSLKHKYPFRENILPFDVPIEVLINKPVHRFRTNEGGYPLIQVGPGIVTLNTIDEEYEWEEFSNSYEELLRAFHNAFQKFENKKFSPSILYLDFFPFNFDDNDVYKFVNENFSVNLEQSFIVTESYPKDINLGFNYKIDLGTLNVSFQKGNNQQGQEGIILQTRIDGYAVNPEIEKITLWYNKAHTIISDLFKKMTYGKLYESFKN